MRFISVGTPGMKNARALCAPRSSSTLKPAAVPIGFAKNRRALGKIGLFLVRRRHRATEALEATADVIERGLVADHRLSDGFCDRDRREVVGRGAEPAGAHDDVGDLREALERLDDARLVVVDRVVLDDLEAEVREAGREPCRVGVHELTARELGTDREDCAGH